MSKLWVVEMKRDGGEWEPTTVVATDGREGTFRRKQMEKQAKLLDSKVSYRVCQYGRLKRGRATREIVVGVGA